MAQKENNNDKENVKEKTKTKPISESRKIRKPLMERKRRERINLSLTSLAKLLTEAKKVKTEIGKPARLEKADILELTVQHLQSITISRSNEGSPYDMSQEEKYREGFSHCIKVVEKIMKKTTSEELTERLVTHLYGKLKRLQLMNKENFTVHDKEENKNEKLDAKDESSSVKDSSNEMHMQDMCSLTLIPKELPDGNIVFILRGNSNNLLKELHSVRQSQNTSTIDSHFEAANNLENHNENLFLKNVELTSISSLSNNYQDPPSDSFLCKASKCNDSMRPKSPFISQIHPSVADDDTPKIQGKSRCPPTPPPSPPTPNDQNQKISAYDPNQSPSHSNIHPYMPQQPSCEYEREEEPFDLSMQRMWRPW